MDYRKQQAYLKSSRLRAIVAVIILLAIAAICVTASGETSRRVLAAFALVIVALAGSIYYTPDYLHLTAVPDKRERWQIKIRWRIVAAVLILGMAFSSTTNARVLVLLTAAWLSVCNVAVKRLVTHRYQSISFWGTDLALLATLILSGWTTLLIGALLLAAAVHLACVTVQLRQFSVVNYGMFSLIVLFSLPRIHSSQLNFAISCAVLVVVAYILTGALRFGAEKQNVENIAAATQELIGFSGYDAARIRQLWETSNQQLAKNWQQAAIPHDDRERMTQWYRDNSELYLFAISAYNLEYKRIKSNLKVIRFARGSCLDYGAGNGEILLELARRGHPVTYFDVDGVTMRFARQRAQQHGLNIQFAKTKDELRAAAGQHGFDTIFSFDVLEHLPDLAGELTFLSALLAPGGVFVFDVPAGSTKAHPMHLDHNLDVLSYLTAKGLKDRRTLSLRMPFRREEKYVFQA
jgi:2-polyprenyl-3-methyl-5-hydroxy-6-metoxy-1,4-benzoquinol methylase